MAENVPYPVLFLNRIPKVLGAELELFTGSGLSEGVDPSCPNGNGDEVEDERLENLIILDLLLEKDPFNEPSAVAPISQISGTTCVL